MIWSKLKIYAAAAVAVVIAALAGALKIRTAQYKKQKKEGNRCNGACGKGSGHDHP